MSSPHSPFRVPHSAFSHPRARFWVTVALLGSLLIHLSLYFWFQNLYMPRTGLSSKDKLALRKFKLERVEINPKWLEPKLSSPKKVSPTPGPDQASLKPADEKRSFAEMLSETPSSSTMPSGSPAVPQEKPIPALGEFQPSDHPSSTSFDQELQAVREQQLSKNAGAGRPILNTPGAPVVPKKGDGEITPPSEVKIGPNQGSPSKEGIPSFKGSNSSDDFFGAGGEPSSKAGKPVIKDTAALLPQSLPDKPKVSQKYESLNSFLNVELFTYEKLNSARAKEGYFLVKITAKPESQSQLKIIPKDVYFVLDVSSSIGPTRLRAYTETLVKSIGLLNGSDRFKVLAFRGQLISFKEEWSPAKTPPLRELITWISNLSSSGVTDFYHSLQPLSQHKRTAGRMAMAFVMSDGMPTKGVLDSTQIISELSEINDNKTSIFTLSTGKQVNNFLLDFLSYGNQGRLQYSENVDGAVEKFEQLVQQVQNPIFLDLRFRFAGVDGEQVYPQNLPNLYQDSPLLLFGRYKPGETSSISLQILGESFQTTKELLVQIPLPKQPNGPETMPTTWARQRIYHLLGRTTRLGGGTSVVSDEVRKLSEDYKVELPYF
jgi:hypothetical protein